MQKYIILVSITIAVPRYKKGATYVTAELLNLPRNMLWFYDEDRYAVCGYLQ